MKHFEKCRVVVDPCSQLPDQPYPPSLSTPSVNRPQEQRQQPQLQFRPQNFQHPQRQYQQSPFNSNDMELNIGSILTSISASSPIPIPATTHFVPYTTQREFAESSLFTPSSLSQPANTSSIPRVASLLPTLGQPQASYRVQAMESELHEVERETDRRLYPFARDVGDRQRRCRSTKGPPRRFLPRPKSCSHLD